MSIEVGRTLTIATEDVTVVARIPANLNDVTAESVAESILKKVQSQREEHYQEQARDDFAVGEAIKEELLKERFTIVLAVQET